MADIFDWAVGRGKKLGGDAFHKGSNDGKHEVLFEAYKGTEDEEVVEFTASDE